jgi:hypothetical protein
MLANVVTVEDLENFKVELIRELNVMISSFKQAEPQKPTSDQQWLKSYQVQRMLGISPGTLQNLRINGKLPYTKVGGMLLYPKDEINKMINGNLRNVNNYGNR